MYVGRLKLLGEKMEYNKLANVLFNVEFYNKLYPHKTEEAKREKIEEITYINKESFKKKKSGCRNWTDRDIEILDKEYPLLLLDLVKLKRKLDVDMSRDLSPNVKWLLYTFIEIQANKDFSKRLEYVTIDELIGLAGPCKKEKVKLILNTAKVRISKDSDGRYVKARLFRERQRNAFETEYSLNIETLIKYNSVD